jgi:hypothetical protein
MILYYFLLLRKQWQLVWKEETMYAGKHSSNDHGAKAELSEFPRGQKFSKANILELPI